MVDSVIISLLIFLLLVFVGIPIAFSMIIAGVFYELVFGGGVGMLMTPFVELRKGITFSVLAVYLFILLGNVLNETRISDYVVEFATSLIPRVSGRAGLITILACAAMGPLTGSANGTTTSVGTIMIPQMSKRGYSLAFSTALQAYSGILGSLIPPSISGLVYALVTRQSIFGVWMATCGVGIIYLVVLALANFVTSRTLGYDISIAKEVKITRSGIAFLKMLPAVLVPIVVLGGIYGGVATPTEIGSLGVLVTFLLGLFFYRTVRSFNQITSAIYTSVRQAAVIMFLVCASFALSRGLIVSGAAKEIAFSLLALTNNTGLLLLFTSFLLIFLGCFMDDIPIIILLAPLASTILLPAGIHPLHLAGVFVFLCLVGLVTPPVGTVLYAAAAVAGTQVNRVLKETYLLFVPAFVTAVIVVFFPEISLFLPRLMHLG